MGSLASYGEKNWGEAVGFFLGKRLPERRCVPPPAAVRSPAVVKSAFFAALKDFAKHLPCRRKIKRQRYVARRAPPGSPADRPTAKRRIASSQVSITRCRVVNLNGRFFFLLSGGILRGCGRLDALPACQMFASRPA